MAVNPDVQALKDYVAEVGGTITWASPTDETVSVTVRVGDDVFTAEAASAGTAAKRCLRTMQMVLG